MRERYGTAEQLIKAFDPEAVQTYAAQHWVRAYKSYAPSLIVTVVGYGSDVPAVIICMHLENLNCFSSVKEKMSFARQKELAKLIITDYPHFKLSEIALFFHRIKGGRYGRFYGSVDALFITEALRHFADERFKDLVLINTEIEYEKELIEARTPIQRTGVTYEEYLQLKTQKEKGETK